MQRLGSNTSFSNLLEEDTPEFIEELSKTIFPGEILPDTKNLRRKRSPPEGEPDPPSKHSQDCLENHSSQASTNCDENCYPDERPFKRLRHGSGSEFVQGSSKDAESCAPSSIAYPDHNSSPSVNTHEDQNAKPLYTSDPISLKDANQVSGYAPLKPNEQAEKMMQDLEFRSTRTSAAGVEFIDNFYKNSRLHHLSTWKTELRSLVAEAQERAEKLVMQGKLDDKDALESLESNELEGFVGKVDGDEISGTSMRGNMFQPLRSPTKSKGKAKQKELVGSEEKVIMHCDFDCFFVSVGLLTRQYLKDQSIVVCHTQGKQTRSSSTSEVASANYKARESGVRAGMSLQQAQKLCPSLVTIPYEFEKYKKASLQLYTILMSHADDLEAVSVDEALIDVTTAVQQMPSSSERHYDPARTFAELLRAEIKSATGCDVSIGISHNIMLARLATRKAKPSGSYHLRLADVQKHIEYTCLDELHGFGPAAREKALERLGAATLGEIAKKPRSVLCDVFGKTTGAVLYDAVRGIDHRQLESDKARKSVSAEINYGIRFENNEQVQAFMFQLAGEVSKRLSAIGMLGRSLTLKIMKRDPNAPVEPPKFLGHGCCNIFNKSISLSSDDGNATGDALVIGQQAWKLLKSLGFEPCDLRGIGIQIQKLEKASSTATRQSRQGQSKLPFNIISKKKEASEDDANKGENNGELILTVQPPSSQGEDEIEIIVPGSTPPTAKSEEEEKEGMASNLFLPSFSQVDRSAFESLPTQIRKEITTEYARRSASPAFSAISDDRTSPSLSPPKRKTTDKGTPLSRIVQALAPRSRDGEARSAASRNIVKMNIFERCEKQKERRGTRVEVTRAELAKLGLDARVFYELPTELQLEQLANARFERSFGKGKKEKSKKK